MEKKKYPRITYRINYCSNEDPEYSSAELLLQSPECKGWQTSRYCSYPVVLVIESIEPVRLRQVQTIAT
jgi:centrosomal protein CEP104